MENTKFEIGKTYRGVNSIGAADLEVVGRTAKTIKVKGCFGVKTCRLSKYGQPNTETIKYKGWMADATDVYTEEQKNQDLFDAMTR